MLGFTFKEKLWKKRQLHIQGVHTTCLGMVFLPWCCRFCAIVSVALCYGWVKASPFEWSLLSWMVPLCGWGWGPHACPGQSCVCSSKEETLCGAFRLLWDGCSRRVGVGVSSPIRDFYDEGLLHAPGKSWTCPGVLLKLPQGFKSLMGQVQLTSRGWCFPRSFDEQVLCAGGERSSGGMKSCYQHPTSLLLSEAHPKINGADRRAPLPLEQTCREQLMNFYGK